MQKKKTTRCLVICYSSTSKLIKMYENYTRMQHMEGHWKIPNQVVMYTERWLLMMI